MQRITLIHTDDQFMLKIDDCEIKGVCGYTLSSESKSKGLVNLTLNLKLRINEIRVDELQITEDQIS